MLTSMIKRRDKYDFSGYLLRLVSLLIVIGFKNGTAGSTKYTFKQKNVFRRTKGTLWV